MALLPASVVRPGVARLIEQRTAAWSEQSLVCADDLNAFRAEHVRSLLEQERGELSSLEKEVLDSLRTQEMLSSHLEDEFRTTRTSGEQLADRVASFGGSWTFILIFGLVLSGWMGVNSALLRGRAFDAYPYILLNLVLSCLAALQAPVIMMSQKRQEARDRLRATNDYQVNLKAELEIRHLHQKLDHLMSHQWERLVEIQEMQLDMMHELQQRP